jgi:uncharacterized protein YecT (DUF1311 family)
MRLSLMGMATLAGLAWAGVGQAAAPKPPVVREAFTPLSCPKHPVTTLAMEGCVEKSILVGDRRVNALVRTIFFSLAPSVRGTFVRGEQSWLRYRHQSCVAAASSFAGGSIEPVVFGACLASRNGTHVHDLRRLRCDALPQDRWPASCKAARH